MQTNLHGAKFAKCADNKTMACNATIFTNKIITLLTRKTRRTIFAFCLVVSICAFAQSAHAQNGTEEKITVPLPVAASAYNQGTTTNAASTNVIQFNYGWQWAPDKARESDFKDLSLDQMHHLADLVPKKRGYILLRNTFFLPQESQIENLSFYIGSLHLAAQISINDFDIGMSGSFPPNEFSPGQSSSEFNIPPFILHFGSTNTLVIKLFVDGTGHIDSMPCIAPSKIISARVSRENFFKSRLNLLISFGLLITSLFFLFLFLSHPIEKEFINYSATLLATVFFLIPFYQQEVHWFIQNLSMLALYKMSYGVAALFTVFFATSFIRSFLKVADTILVRLVRLTYIAMLIIWALMIPSYQVFWRVLPIFYVIGFMQMSFAIYTILQQFKTQKQHVLVLLSGFIPVFLTLIIDFIEKILCKVPGTPLYTIWGWQLTTFSFLFILSKRYGAAQLHVEELNTQLEMKVLDRTRELKLLNDELEKESNENMREIKLAVQVQRNFYPHDVIVDNDWSIAVYFQPMAGVSGDLYDIYRIDNNLRGLGLFDVSGHGIAAALVTMLAKNVIFRTWKENLNLDLASVMEKVNEAVIKAKGSIENYMTGILIRTFDAQSGKCELVNAGSPPPLLFSAKTGTVKPLFPDKAQHGMIGIAGIDVSFLPISFTMDEGDMLILYTDGITEARNKTGDDYGAERLSQSIENSSNVSAERTLSNILRDFMRFTKEMSQKDDITLIVLKRQLSSTSTKTSASANAKPSTLIDNEQIEELEPIDELEEIEELTPIDDD